MNKVRFLCFIFMIISCKSPVQKKEQWDKSALDSLADVIDSISKNDGKKKNTVLHNWIYTEENDTNGTGKIYRASLAANELLDFNFPYNGGAVATIQLSNETGHNNVQLCVSKGLFNSSFSDGMCIQVCFDEKEPVRFYCSNLSVEKANPVSINNPDKFIDGLKKAQRVVIEADFSGSGMRRMEFMAGKLKWEH